ncbi:ABC transporter ATPase CcmA [Klebsiella quasipneumoniae]|nr:ABC transporter ATPase CcmA [Klebsiella quasipneumoniae]
MLHAERLTCIVDDRPLFAELTLSLAAGELLQVAGDNGAGKPRCCGSSAAWLARKAAG